MRGAPAKDGPAADGRDAPPAAENDAMLPQLQSLAGLIAIPLIAWAISERRSLLAPPAVARLVLAALAMQVADFVP